MGSSGYGPSLYADPQAVYNCFRNPILGIDDGHNGGVGDYRGQSFWNVDFSIKKNVMFTERISAEFGAVFTNIFNHNQLIDPYNALTDTGDFGALGFNRWAKPTPRGTSSLACACVSNQPHVRTLHGKTGKPNRLSRFYFTSPRPNLRRPQAIL